MTTTDMMLRLLPSPRFLRCQLGLIVDLGCKFGGVGLQRFWVDLSDWVSSHMSEKMSKWHFGRLTESQGLNMFKRTSFQPTSYILILLRVWRVAVVHQTFLSGVVCRNICLCFKFETVAIKFQLESQQAVGLFAQSWGTSWMEFQACSSRPEWFIPPIHVPGWIRISS